MRRYLGQQHGLQSMTLTSISIKISIGKFICTFMKMIFNTNLLIWSSYFQIQQPKIYSRFIIPIFDSNLVQNVFYLQYGRGIKYNNIFGTKLILFDRCLNLVFNNLFKDINVACIFCKFGKTCGTETYSSSFCSTETNDSPPYEFSLGLDPNG
jgi:hypothetical protein